MTCVSSVSYSLLINGKRSERFVPSRGLRQRDHLSPYFILIADVLSRMINQVVMVGAIKPSKMKRSYLELSHLFFTDDSLSFMEAHEAFARHLMSILDLYCQP